MISFLLRRRVAVALLVLMLSLLCGVAALSLQVDPGVEALLPSAGPDRAALKRFHEAFGSDEVIVVALHSDRLFTAEGLRALEDLTARAAALPRVARVLSPTNARDLDGDELGPFKVDFHEELTAGKITPPQLGARLASHPLLGGLLVSPDARTAALLLELDLERGAGDRRRELVEQTRALAAGAPPWIESYVAGLPVEKVDVARLVLRDQGIFAPLILLVVGLALGLLYRRAIAVVLPLTVILGSMTWALGLYALSGRTLNPVTSLIMPVMLVTSVEGTIHFLNHFMAARSRGLEREPALQHAWALARVPIFNAALTTAIGFGSLVLLPIPAIRDFGLFTAAGVMLAWALTTVLMPLMLSVAPERGGPQAGAFEPGRLERVMKWIAGLVWRHPWRAGAASAVVLVACLLGVQRIRVETDIIGSLRASTPLAQAARFIDTNLTGVNALEIIVSDVEPLDPAAMRRVEAFGRSLDGLPGVRKVTGLAGLYARANRAFHNGDDAYARLPDGDTAAADLRDIHDLLAQEAPEELRRFIGPDGRTLRLTAHVTAMDTAFSQELLAAIRQRAAHAGLDVTLTGDFVVLSNMSTTLVYNQLSGLIPALTLILVAMAVQFRSVRLGLLVMIPSGAPVLMVYGLMGWAGIPLSVPTAMIASIAIGMTVDHIIHLMARFWQDLAASGSPAGALDRMIETSGRGVVYSVVTLTLGFWVGVFSSFVPSVHFAVLTGATFVLGLLSDLVLLPLVMRTLAIDARGARGAARAVGACLLAACFLLQSGPASAGVPVLKDQFGHSGGPSLHAGNPVLVIYGQPSDLRRMKSWELEAQEKAGAGACAVVRAVDASTVRGKKTESEINERLQRGVPPDIAILVDWDGALRAAYHLPASGVSTTLLDPAGRVCATLSGPVNASSLKRLAGLIAGVREKGSCP